jgi:phage-related protein
MFEVFFYADGRGKQPTRDYIKELAERTDKGNRIRAQKINDYLQYLYEQGKNAGEPYVKRIDGEIWELRPTSDRILFAAWDGKSFIILHHFVKKTRKTPQREIDKAKRNLADYRERNKK